MYGACTELLGRISTGHSEREIGMQIGSIRSRIVSTGRIQAAELRGGSSAGARTPEVGGMRQSSAAVPTACSAGWLRGRNTAPLLRLP